MSHIMVPRLFERKRKSSKDGSQADDAWWVVDPPYLHAHFLLADIAERLDDELADAAFLRKLGFVGLRLLQHFAYRAGYGSDRVPAAPLPTGAPDTCTMEGNLGELPAVARMGWLHSYLGCLNTPDIGGAPRLPDSVVFELSQTCNLSCVACEVGRDGVRADKFMRVEDLQRWAGALCQRASHIRINGLGEATLHPQLGACIGVLAAFPGSREIITNLTAPMATYEMLLEAGYLMLVSWDGSTAETFQRIRRGSDFEALRAKLPRLANSAATRGSPAPILLFTLRPENLAELADTVALAADAGIEQLTVNTLKLDSGQDWTAPHRDDIRRAFDKAEERASTDGVRLVLPDHIGDEAVRSDAAHRCSASGCRFPWTQVVVRWDGTLTPCNMMNPYMYGSLGARAVEATWNGPEARAFRSRANTPGCHPFCEGCYYVDPNRRRDR